MTSTTSMAETGHEEGVNSGVWRLGTWGRIGLVKCFGVRRHWLR